MTLLVRDEADIIACNIRFHLEQGIDHFVVVDNGSVDGTRDLLADLARQGVVSVIDEPRQTFDQGAWMTRAALQARDVHGADWIVHSDADEFWLGRTGTVRQAVTTRSAGILKCPRRNMLHPWDAAGALPWVRACVHRVAVPSAMPRQNAQEEIELSHPYFYYALHDKVITKANALIRVMQGNIDAQFSKETSAETGEIDIFHFPVRSHSQFLSKIVNGAESYLRNTTLPASMGWHWRRWYRLLQTRGLEAALADALPCEGRLQRDLASGVVVTDTAIRDLLERLSQSC